MTVEFRCMTACTLLSDFTREEYEGGSEPGLVLWEEDDIFFFAIEQDDGTRNHLPAPGQQGLPPTHLLPGQELHLLIRDPPPLSPPHPPAPLLSSKHPLYQGHNDFIFHKQWTILKRCHRLAELYWMWFYLLSFFRYMYFIIFNDLYSFV